MSLPYPLAADFESAVVMHLCFTPTFYQKFATYLVADRFNALPARQLAALALNYGQHSDRGPGHLTVVSQQLANMRRDGKLTDVELGAISDYIEDALMAMPDHDVVATAFAPVLRRTVEIDGINAAAAALASPGSAALEAAKDTIAGASNIGAEEIAPKWSPMDGAAMLGMHSAGSAPRLPFGIEELDALIGGGPERGTMTIVSAKSGHGKSMMLSTVAAASTVRRLVTLIISTEMTKKRWMPRFMGAILDVPYRDLDDSNTVAYKLAAKRTARVDREKLWNWPDFLYAGAGRTATDIVAMTREWEKDNGTRVDVLILDYLDDIEGDGVVRRKGKNSGPTQSHKADDNAAKFLQQWAENEDRWLFTAVQPQRRSGKEYANKDIGGDDLSGGMGKVRRSDLCITARKVEVEETPGVFVRYYFAKDRHNGAQEQGTDPIPVDWSRGRSSVVPPFDWSAA